MKLDKSDRRKYRQDGDMMCIIISHLRNAHKILVEWDVKIRIRGFFLEICRYIRIKMLFSCEISINI